MPLAIFSQSASIISGHSVISTNACASLVQSYRFSERLTDLGTTCREVFKALGS